VADISGATSTGSAIVREVATSVEVLPPDPVLATDCNTNGVFDACDLAVGASADCQQDGVPDDCQLAYPCLEQDGSVTPLGGSPSDAGCSDGVVRFFSHAEQFLSGPAGAELMSIRFRGGYVPSGIPPAVDQFAVYLRADSRGLPGSALISLFNVLPTSRTLTGRILANGQPEYEYVIAIPPMSAILPETNYWVEIQYNADNGPDCWVWSRSMYEPGNPGSPGSAFRTTGSWTAQTYDHYLIVTCVNDLYPPQGDGIPDECNCPSTLACVLVDANVCTCDTCTSAVCVHTPVKYGNVTCDANNVVNLDDILCTVNAFGGGLAVCPNADLAPACTGNNLINLDDILAQLAAFGGSDPCGCN
jgi:hypothetical protein